MIKVGITGGHSRTAGQLVRLLLHHPDVVLTRIHAGMLMAGMPVSTIYRGLDGETSLRFEPGEHVRLDGIDVLFVADGNVDGLEIPDTLRTVSLTGTGAVPDAVYGLPELNRKPLVRGARHAVVPSAIATAVVTPLLPLARNLLLNSEIRVSLRIGADDSALRAPGRGEIAGALKSLQSSFNAPVNIHAETPAGLGRGIIVSISTAVAVDAGTLDAIYREYFDDHNLVEVIDRVPEQADVLGTAKCLVNVERDSEGGVSVSAAIDGPLKGSAAQGVHVMNLLMGLHEKTGLNLPAYTF